MNFGKYYFHFNGKQYGTNTVVKIYEDKIHKFCYYNNVIFLGYDLMNDGLYHFAYPDDKWKGRSITEDELTLYIEEIVEGHPYVSPQECSKKIDSKYIDGIVDAWIWYIIVMIFAIFVNGIGNVIGIWIFASSVFWTWRHNKMNGG